MAPEWDEMCIIIAITPKPQIVDKFISSHWNSVEPKSIKANKPSTQEQ